MTYETNIVKLSGVELSEWVSYVESSDELEIWQGNTTIENFKTRKILSISSEWKAARKCDGFILTYQSGSICGLVSNNDQMVFMQTLARILSAQLHQRAP